MPKEYQIIENLPNKVATEEMLNEFALDGWSVVSFQQFQILLEREKKNDKQDPQQING